MKPGYTLVWWKSAEQDLIKAYLQTENRRQLSELVNQVEDALESYPERVGQDYHEGIRRVDVGNWLLYFTVSEPDRMVEVVTFRGRR